MISGFVSWAVKNAVWFVMLSGVWIFLPDAAPGSGTFTMPTIIVDSIATVVHLDRYLPILPLLTIAAFELGFRTVMFQLWLVSWVTGKVNGTG